MKKLFLLSILLSSSCLIETAIAESKTLNDLLNKQRAISEKIDSKVPEILKFKKMQKYGEENKTLKDIFRPKK